MSAFLYANQGERHIIPRVTYACLGIYPTFIVCNNGLPLYFFDFLVQPKEAHIAANLLLALLLPPRHWSHPSLSTKTLPKLLYWYCTVNLPALKLSHNTGKPTTPHPLNTITQFKRKYSINLEFNSRPLQARRYDTIRDSPTANHRYKSFPYNLSEILNKTPSLNP